MFTSGQRKQLAIRKPLSPHEHLMGASALFPTMDPMHVCFTCERETEIPAEEDVPVDNVESITFDPLLPCGAMWEED